MISLKWHENKGEGVVKYSKVFIDSHIVVKLDLLQDCIADLQKQYEELLNNPYERGNRT
jgi:hypothetical protein